jgi:transglutaminase-like putative cysteine protease
MNDLEKWNFLRFIAATDRWDDNIIKIAKHLLAAATCCDGVHSWQRRFAMLAHTVARDWIHQVSDTVRTGGEDIAGLTREPREDDATDALSRGSDDCDAKSRLFVALCLAGGLRARIVPYWKKPGGPTTHERDAYGAGGPPPGSQLYHVAAEVWLDNAWQPVELTLSRARLGERGELVPFESGTRKWKDA